MSAHIVAIGGGGLAGIGDRYPMFEHVLSLTGKDDPRVLFVNTASGDDARATTYCYDLAREVGVVASHLDLFPMPNVRDVRSHVLAHDAVYVGGGSTANLLAVWRAHGLDTILREANDNGVVLAGTSAGSICWFEGGVTDSFGIDLRALTNGLAFLATTNAPHYDSEERRRPLYQRLVREGTLAPGYAADDGVGLVFENGTFAEAVTYRDSAGAYRVEADGETRIAPRRL